MRDEIITEVTVEYAGFWRRVMATIIDTLIFGIPSFVLQYCIIRLVSIGSGKEYTYTMYVQNELPLFLDGVLQATGWVIWIAIIAYFLSSKWQATPGKRVMKAYVTGTDHQPISLKRAACRALLPALITLPLFFMMPSEIERKEFDAQYVATLTELMPLTASELADSKVTPQTFIQKVYSDPHTRAIYLQEFDTLSKEQQNTMKEAAKTLSEKRATPVDVGYYFGWCLFIMLWYGIAGLTPEKTTMHDIFMKTRVLKGRPC